MAEKLAPEKRHNFVHNGKRGKKKKEKERIFIKNPIFRILGFLGLWIEFYLIFFFFGIFAGQKVFEWDQTLDEVNIYIDLPPKVPKNLFHAKIQSQHLEVGIKGNPPYLNVCIDEIWFLIFLFWWSLKIIYWIVDLIDQHDLAAAVKTDSSFWTIGNVIGSMPSIIIIF